MGSPSSKNSASQGQKITLALVAEVAGVSKASASKALNNRKDVSADTRRRVQEACQRLGYQPTTMRTPTHPRIALVADNLSTSYTLEVLKGATTEAMRRNIALYLSHTSIDASDLPEGHHPLSKEWITQIKAEGYLGLITLTSRLEDAFVSHLRRAGLPHVAIDPASTPPLGTASIGATNWNGGREATQHLIDLGHRKIAFIHGPHTSVPARERHEGYLSAMRGNHLNVDPAWIVGHDFSYEGGYRAGLDLLDLPEAVRPTAVFASNDMAAFGVYEAARERGIHIPHDLSVVGFDDTDMALWATPRLTTVHQPLLNMGAAAVSTLIDLGGNSPATPSHPVQLSTHLVVRDSSAAAPA
ncbi:LacI family DNA-binding transcriptional regulator [Schaalia suimastitidis]|uniref:LacI family DNA-binding transcriptional regulator n=1 Tax=Schaalia suimastitidis TaxID=121163 RepID=UPI00047B454A|nr:LacI family DNA-binding transcriptional regulator [Schaalia suimastitidis]